MHCQYTLTVTNSWNSQIESFNLSAKKESDTVRI